MAPSLQRDKNGWRIPYKGTFSWEIYQLMIYGFKPEDIYKIVGNNTSARVLVHNIKHPDRHNARGKNYYRNKVLNR